MWMCDWSKTSSSTVHASETENDSKTKTRHLVKRHSRRYEIAWPGSTRLTHHCTCAIFILLTCHFFLCLSSFIMFATVFYREWRLMMMRMSRINTRSSMFSIRLNQSRQRATNLTELRSFQNSTTDFQRIKIRHLYSFFKFTWNLDDVKIPTSMDCPVSLQG